MPFDAARLRQPTITILPPTPPERGGGPRRIRIEIEIVDLREMVKRLYHFGTFTLWLLVLLLLAALAHSEECLSYGDNRTVSGTVSVERGNWLELHLSPPICVAAGDETEPAETNVKVMHIFIERPAGTPIDRSLAGKNVRITGELFHSFTIHHNTPVLIAPKKIERLP